MLEESLNSPHYPADDVTTALLSFIKHELPAGGTSAEVRFCRLFPQIMTRVFGSIDKSSGANFNHMADGWLSTTAATMTKSLERNKSPHRLGGGKNNTNALGLLLRANNNNITSSNNQGQRTLIDAIIAESIRRPDVRFAYPLGALPRPTQLVLMTVCEAKAATTKTVISSPFIVDGVRDNAVAWGKLLLSSSQTSDSLGQQQQRSVVIIRHDSRRMPSPSPSSPGLFSPGPPRHFQSPQSVSAMAQGNKTNTNGLTQPGDSVLMLRMMDYYLLTFIRYPLACCETSSSKQQPNNNSRPSTTPPRPSSNNFYIKLFQSYLRQFLPHHRRSLSPDGEILLRIVNELWLEGDNSIHTTCQAQQRLAYISQGGGNQRLIANVSSEVQYSPYELVQISGQFYPNPPVVQQSIKQFVIHAVTDPLLHQSLPKDWCLTPLMTGMQKSFYNYLRLVLRYAPVHTVDSPFFAAVEAWLIWIEPWNVVTRNHGYKLPTSASEAKSLLLNLTTNPTSPPTRMTSLAIPLPTTPSRYHSRYVPYIASNYHFYTTLLALFLKRSRELDFSDFTKSFGLVRRVLRVFSSELLREDLSRLGIESVPGLLRHNNILGLYCPPKYEMNQQRSPRTSPSIPHHPSFTTDAHNLLEEIVVQHQKTIKSMDWVETLTMYVEQGFGYGAKAEETAIGAVIELVKSLAGLPLDYEVLVHQKVVSRQRNSRGGGRIDKPEMIHGYLSERGRDDITSGRKKCRPTDVITLGDPMTSRARSYEIPLLVTITCELSNYLNEHLLGIRRRERNSQEEDDIMMAKLREGEEMRRIWFRINLRFLADVRNVMALVVVYYVSRVFS